MKHRSEECAVTGREVSDPVRAPRSRVNEVSFVFCTSTCKEIFDRDLVKFAEKRYPAKNRHDHFTPINLKYKP